MTAFSSRSRFHAQENRLTNALARARRDARPLLDLTESNPTRAGLSPDQATLTQAFSYAPIATYDPQPFGLAEARQAVVDALADEGIMTQPDRVVLTASTSEAYGYLFRLLCDAGDSVLVPSPSYPLFDVLAQLEGVRLIPYPLAYDGEWPIDVSALAARREPRTRAIVTVHPNNPTGSFLKRDELRDLAALGLPIISDEVFSQFALDDDPARATSALDACDRALVFRLGGLSKSLALPQLKLAWMVVEGPGSHEARARLEHIADAFLSPGAQVQVALPRLLALGPAVRAQIRARVCANLTRLRAAVRDSACSVAQVEGGWYAIVRLPAVQDDEAWALALLAEDDVLVQPGYYYDLTSGTYVVLSLICEPALFAAGVTRLVARVQTIAG